MSTRTGKRLDVDEESDASRRRAKRFHRAILPFKRSKTERKQAHSYKGVRRKQI